MKLRRQQTGITVRTKHKVVRFVTLRELYYLVKFLPVAVKDFPDKIFDVIYWFAVVVISTRSPTAFSKIRLKNIASPPCFFGVGVI